MEFNLNEFDLPNSFNIDNIDINYLLDPSYFVNFSKDSIYDSLFKEHSWQTFIFVTNPIRIDNSTLIKNPETFKNLAKLINFYNQTLLKLIGYRVMNGDFNREKWNLTLDKLKSFLYSRIKEIIDEVPNSNISNEVKEYIDSCLSNGIPFEKDIINNFNIPKNVLNNYISNSKRNFNKS